MESQTGIRYAQTGDGVPLVIISPEWIEALRPLAERLPISQTLMLFVDRLIQPEDAEYPGSLVIERGAFLIICMLLAQAEAQTSEPTTNR